MTEEDLEERVEISELDFIEEITEGIKMYHNVILQLEELHYEYQIDKENYIVQPYKTSDGLLSYKKIKREKIGF